MSIVVLFDYWKPHNATRSDVLVHAKLYEAIP